MGAVKSLTFEERCLIEEGIKKNLSLNEISRRIKRGKNTCVSEYRRNKNNDGTYTAKEAQAKSEKRKIEARIKVAAHNKTTQPKLMTYHHRLLNLEAQLEILSDCIKELMAKQND